MVEVRYKLIPAGFWLRAVALGIDNLLAFPAIGLITAVPLLIEMNQDGTTMSVTRATFIIACLLYAFLYPAAMEASSYRATLGKRMLGLRVVTLAGRQISFGQSLGRTFAKLISQAPFGLGFLLAAWTEKKQALHDKMAGTLVMKRVPVYIERAE